MGCFDSVCSISHVPVQYGDEVVVIYVGADFSIVLDKKQYCPVFLPTKGTYDDYGDVENIESSTAHAITDQIFNKFFVKVCPPTKRTKDSFDVFKDEIRTGKQCLPGEWTQGKKEPQFVGGYDTSYGYDVYNLNASNGTNVSRMFIHREVYDYLVNYGANQPMGWKNKTCLKEYSRQIPAFVRSIRRNEQYTKLYYDTLKHKGDEAIATMELPRVLMSCLSDKEFDYDHIFNRMFHRFEESFPHMMFRSVVEYKKKLVRLCVDELFDEAEKLVEAMFELTLFSIGLYHHNLEFSPHKSHAVNQHQEKDSAMTMIRLFTVFTNIQQKKLNRITQEEE